MQPVFFKESKYSTPVSERPTLFERLRRNSQLYFIFKYGTIVLRTRRQARAGIYDDVLWADSSHYIFRFLEKAGGRFQIEGMEHITESPEPVLFIGNHMSTLETMILPCMIAPKRKVTFVVKESLVKHPLFKDVMISRQVSRECADLRDIPGTSAG